MHKTQTEYLIDHTYIELQIQRLHYGSLKQSSLSSYISRSLRGEDKNLKDYVNNQIVKAIYRYNQVNGED